MKTKFKVLVILLTLALSKVGGSAATLPLFSENFDGISLGASYDQTPGGTNVWARLPPAGWRFDQSRVPGYGNLTNDGVVEWSGWSFASAAWWQSLGLPSDLRSAFSNASGTILIADGGLWSNLPTRPAP